MARETCCPHPFFCAREERLWRTVSSGRSCAGGHDRKYWNFWRKPGLLRYSYGGSLSRAQYAFFSVSDSYRREPIRKREKETGHPLSFAFRSRYKVHNAKLWDAILKGRKGGYPGDFKFFYVVCANPLNQIPNTNKGVQALKSLDFIVVQDHFINSTARFADILLPATTHWERDDYMRPWLGGDYHLFGNQAIEPIGETKSDFQIAWELANHLGINDYSEKNETEWIEEIIFSSTDSRRDIENYDEFRSQGIAKAKVKKPVIAFEDQIRDPGRFPFSTPSGKIEIYSKDLADLNDPQLPPIPKYIEPWEGPQDPLIEKFPLQLITFHFKTRAHSNFYNIDWLRELESHEIWINPVDAVPRRSKMVRK